ncbi:LCP family protein [Kutzneria sp. NPDC052558]|uniref:LCP family protein n=1 Tax=Kutzneria sp. NPDC052558 TaxID=3364121 RepID=UPI0037CA53CF
MGKRAAVLAGKVVAATASVAVLATFGVAYGTYEQLQGLGSSSAINPDSPKSKDGAQNILVMGLTTRLDLDGNPLPPAVEAALHAGDGSRGGYNTNTMIVVHVPNDGSKATAVSVPRDDEVTFVDTLYGERTGKIKEAYGLAKAQKQEELYAKGERGPQLERDSREAGRAATIANIEHLLDIPIDHFAEISLAGFYDLATQLGGIDVCLNHATSDTNAGANFKQGRQHLDGAQALAFVRQRDNLPNNDLDRTHRQQAFLASVTTKLKGQGVFGSLGKMQDLLTVASKDVVMDKDWDLLAFAQQATALTSGNIEFHTLPILGYGKDANGQDINNIDVPTVRAVVHTLFAPPAATTGAPAPTTTTSAPPAIKGQGSTVDIRNAGAPDGTGKKLSDALAANGFKAGEVTPTARQATTTVYYGSAAKEDATALAALLGNAKLVASSAAAAHHVALYLGADFTWPATLSGGATASTPTSVPIPTEGPQGGAVMGGDIPCVD